MVKALSQYAKDLRDHSESSGGVGHFIKRLIEAVTDAKTSVQQLSTTH